MECARFGARRESLRVTQASAVMRGELGCNGSQHRGMPRGNRRGESCARDRPCPDVHTPTPREKHRRPVNATPVFARAAIVRSVGGENGPAIGTRCAIAATSAAWVRAHLRAEARPGVCSGLATRSQGTTRGASHARGNSVTRPATSAIASHKLPTRRFSLGACWLLSALTVGMVISGASNTSAK